MNQALTGIRVVDLTNDQAACCAPSTARTSSAMRATGAPRLAQHQSEILAELGYRETDIEALAKDGAI
jgi:crotonobetainyl-CoA:carnitine CoA-transferase CaiB-like acyl-CoA transferase